MKSNKPSQNNIDAKTYSAQTKSNSKSIDCELHLDIRDYIRGSLMGGAAGDALGYPIEFMSRQSILSKYGAKGITTFDLDDKGRALISDDTQMTLFTANGILMGITREYMKGISIRPEKYVDYAYLDWYYTQTGKKATDSCNDIHYTWLRDLPELAHRRAPGITCLKACDNLLHKTVVMNNSKGCGGIMRVAPLALFLGSTFSTAGNYTYSISEMAEAGAKIAAITHKHALGFLPAGIMTEVLFKILPLSPAEVQEKIYKIVEESIHTLNNSFEGKYATEKEYLIQLTRLAVELAQSDCDDIIAIQQLGEGWVAEEAWAISLFCTLRHITSVKDAIIAAVNHDGDSDSTGAITGNLMGAIYGYEYIKSQHLFCKGNKEFEDTIELANIILTLADDLTSGCIIDKHTPIDTTAQKQWYDRYCRMIPTGI